VAARKDEPRNSVDQPSSTVTVPPTAPHPLVGAWLIDETPYVASFQSNGVYQQVDSDHGGTGVWEATGPNSGAVTWIVPSSEGLAKFRATFEVSSDGQSVTIDWEGEELTEPPQELGSGSQTGTRINVEPMGTPVGPITEAPATTG
jgi:hypothetical protein